VPVPRTLRKNGWRDQDISQNLSDSIQIISKEANEHILSQNDEFTVLLSHNPDTLPYLSNCPWDLMLSGHTHGRQVVLPGIGAPWTPVTNMQHRRGGNLGDSYLNVATGTGGLFQLWKMLSRW